jgi:hypothetical protein
VSFDARNEEVLYILMTNWKAISQMVVLLRLMGTITLAVGPK